MRSVCLVFVCATIVFSACKEVTIKRKMLPAITDSDSAVVMYYHLPGEPRFFNITKVKGSNPLPVVATDVNDRVISAKDNCTTQGNIYFYGKSGAIEVIYFSRLPDCMILSFMKTGEKYFTTMSPEAKAILDSLEKNVTVLPGRQE
jgi:hypothetical protein